MAHYLYRRNGRYYFRIRIPSNQKQHFDGKQEIRKSLGTYNRQVAIPISARMLAYIKEKFTPADIDALHKALLNEDKRLQDYLDPKMKWMKIKKDDA